MSGYNLFLQLMSYFYRYSTCFIVFIPRPVTTSFDRFFAVFAVPVHGSCILKLSGTGPVRGPSKKGNRTETGPDFKALTTTVQPYPKSLNILSFCSGQLQCFCDRLSLSLKLLEYNNYSLSQWGVEQIKF